MKKRIAALILVLALAMGLTGGMVFAADDEDAYTEITVGGEYTAVFEVDAEDYDEDEGNAYWEEVILSLTPEESGAYAIFSSAENASSISVSVENSETYKDYTAADEYTESVLGVYASGYNYDNQKSIDMWLEAGVEYYIVCSFYAYSSVELTISVESYDGVVPVSAEYAASEADHYYTLATGFVSYDNWEYYDEYIYISSLYDITDELYHDSEPDENGTYYITDYFGIILVDIEDVIILTYSDGTTEELYADEEDPEFFISENGEKYSCGAAWANCEQLPGTGEILYMTALIGGNECSFSVTIPCTIINLADVDIDADNDTAGSGDSSSDDDSDGTASDNSSAGTSSADTDDASAASASLSIIDSETTASYTLGSASDAVIAVDADIADFISVTVDGTVLTRDADYTVTEGSTIITFTESFLESLSEGDHDVVIAFEDGDVETTLSIAAASSSGSESTSPETGDCANLAFWTALALLSAFGLAVSVLRRRFS